MRWRCLKCKDVVEREDEMLTAVYCCDCGCWRSPLRPVSVRVRKPTKRAAVIAEVARVTSVRIPGHCGHAHPLIIEEGPDQNFLFEEPGQSN